MHKRLNMLAVERGNHAGGYHTGGAGGLSRQAFQPRPLKPVVCEMGHDTEGEEADPKGDRDDLALKVVHGACSITM